MRTLIKIGLYFIPVFLIKLYIKRKGNLGKNFSIGNGSFIKGGIINIGNDVRIGNNVIIISNEITLGDRVRIEDSCFIKSTIGFSMGKDSYFENNNFVGGIQTADSVLEIGDRVGIYPHCFINTSKKVIIRNDTGIGGYSQLFTHGSWQNALEGFPYVFGPITIDENVWIPWRVFIKPNVVIGKNVVIGSNSVISANIPPDCYAEGNPCKVLLDNVRRPIKNSDLFKYKKMKEIFSGMILDCKAIDGIEFALEVNDEEMMLKLKSESYSVIYSNEEHQDIDPNCLKLINKEVALGDRNVVSMLNYKALYQTSLNYKEVFKYFGFYGIKFDFIR